MPIKPGRPEIQRQHPLYRGQASTWSLKALYPCHERGGATVANLAAHDQDATLSGGSRVATPDGPGIALNGSSDYINGGTGPDVAGAARLSVWARLILRATPANGAYSGIISQWNDPVANNASYQRFNLGVYNNAFTRPATSLDFNILLDTGSFTPVCTVQYQAADVGSAWTVVVSWDGATLRHWARFPSGIVTNSVSAAAPLKTLSVSPTNTIVGRIDGFYSNMVFLGGGIWTGRALTFRDFLDLHRDPWGLVTPPWSPPRASATSRPYYRARPAVLGSGIY